jgi:hypothetical protein
MLRGVERGPNRTSAGERNSNVKSLLDLSSEATKKAVLRSSREKKITAECIETWVSSQGFTESLERRSRAQSLHLVMPIEQRAGWIYKQDLSSDSDDELFSMVYTEPELSKLRDHKKKREIIEKGLSDTDDRLDRKVRKVMSDLRKNALVDLISEELDSGKRKKLSGKLEKLEKESPDYTEDYTEGEYEEAVNKGWQERLPLVLQVMADIENTYSNSPERAYAQKLFVRRRWENQDERDVIWKGYLSYVEELDRNS